MLINTPDGWRQITGRQARSIREATSFREMAAKMHDEIAALCPGLTTEASGNAASMLAATLAKMRA